MLQGLAAGPVLQPLGKHLDELRALGGGSSAGRLVAAIAGGFPAQACVFDYRRVVDHRCQRCLQCPGFVKHRLYERDGHALLRRDLDPPR